jgi:hypothetical protein
VNIYDAVTFAPRQFLRAPETVTKMQGSPDGSILFFAHSYSVTMWDVQTGGLIHTFTMRSEITDVAVSTTGNYVACGSSDGSITSWNIHTKNEGKGFGNGQPVVTICWLSPVELAVATQRTVDIHNVEFGETLASFSIPGRVWGMVYSSLGGGEFLVGASQQGEGMGREGYSLEIIKHIEELSWRHLRKEAFLEIPEPPQMHLGPLPRSVVADKEIVCITNGRGVQSFHLKSLKWTENPPLLDAATSVAVSLNRNLVAQTEASIQIFSLDVLGSRARNIAWASHIYPLGEKHIVCLLQPNRYIGVLDLETLRELHPDDYTSPLQPLLKKQSPSARSFVAVFGVPAVIKMWQSRVRLLGWIETNYEDIPLGGLSPDCAWIVTLYGSPRRELHVKDAKDGTILANLLLEDGDLEMGKVYDVAFDSEARFHLKIDGPGWHVRVPHDIIASPSGLYSYTIIKGKPVSLSEPRKTPPYALDANCEWVVDTEFRKICWISPGNVRRGDGGHFWAGLELVMVGDDGVVRKLSFREPDC